MGVHKFVLYDNDIIEEGNLANQAYDVEHVGQYKVEALAAVLKRFNPEVQVVINNRFFEEEDGADLEGPLVIATDTMSSRQTIYSAFTGNMLVDTVFEARLGFDFGEVNIIDNCDPDALSNWKNGLLDDKDVPEGPCGLKICTTLVMLISSYLVHSICEKYSAAAKEEEWQYHEKTAFYLKNGLVVFNPKKRR